MVAAAFAVSLTLRLHQEETGLRAETAAASTHYWRFIWRWRWPDRRWRPWISGGPDFRLRRSSVTSAAAFTVWHRPCNCRPCGCYRQTVIVRCRGSRRWRGVGRVFIALYPLGSLAVPADAAQPGAVRPHPAGRRRFHRGAAGCWGHRCAPITSGRHGLRRRDVRCQGGAITLG